MLVEFIPLVENPYKLSYKTAGDSGIDLPAQIDAPFTLDIGGRAMIPTGYKCKLAPGYEGQIRSRSGLALNHGIIVLNAPGTVDNAYSGSINVILYNCSNKMYTINPGDRIAQFIVASIVREWAYDEVTPVERGIGGFGSTGV
jgi:dUTP pyrophosphatase